MTHERGPCKQLVAQVVSLELEFSPHSGALLSAPSHMGDHGLQVRP